MPNITIDTTDSTTLYYEEQGSGRPLVFIHGLGASHTMWEPQVDAFSPAYRVITFDVRGSGQSGRLRGWKHILSRQAADFKLLFDHLAIERAVLCGVSYGGVLAQRFALDYPDRCAGLVIGDSFSDTRPHSLGELGLIIVAYLAAPTFLLPTRWFVPAIRRQYARWPLAQRHLVECFETLRGLETMKNRLAINRIDYTAALGRIHCPTLGIVGGDSKLMVGYMRRLIGAIPGARLEIVPDSLDPSNLCQPEVFNQLLSDFLAAPLMGTQL